MQRRNSIVLPSRTSVDCAPGTCRIMARDSSALVPCRPGACLMKDIATLTMNPTIDVSYDITRMHTTHKMHTGNEGHAPVRGQHTGKSVLGGRSCLTLES